MAIARHPRVVLGACAFVLLLCALAYPALQRALGSPDFQVNRSDSARVEKLLERSFPGLGSENDALVFYSSAHNTEDRVYRGVIASVDAVLRRQRGVRSILGPYEANAVGQIAPDEHTAVTGITLGGNADQRFRGTRALQDAASAAAGNSGVHVWLTGPAPIAKDNSEAQKANSAHAEGIGLPVAFLILLLAMGALVAATLPLLLAITGLLLADGVLAVLTIFFHFDIFLLAIVTMIGLGVGIDYAMFVVSRFREELARVEPAQRRDPERVAHAVGVALDTSGRTILFSGVIVALSLASLFVVEFGLIREIAIGAVVVVICMLAVAMTLLPAVLALLGAKVDRGALPRRLRPANLSQSQSQSQSQSASQSASASANGGRRGGAARWALLMMRHPLPAASIAAVVLIVAALPALHLRLGLDLGVLRDAGTASGKGEQALARAISPGVVSPIEVLITSRKGSGGAGPEGASAGSEVASARAEVASAKLLSDELESDQRVTGLLERRRKAGVLLVVVPSTPVDSSSATALVEHIRKTWAPAIEARGGPRVLVGGLTAQAVDVAHEFHSRFLLMLSLILASSLLLLLLAFRSLLLPIKAVAMNLLATSASMGIVVLVFQEGHAQHLLGFTSRGFIQVLVPLIMFALLFGLSMDYEIFLIRRMQEEWRKTGENRLAVASGIEHTARPITAAAAIMVAVFGSFVAAGLLELKQLGFALAIAVALDATLVRLVLVPAAMRLFGAWNWWLPAWLARLLPELGVD